jgi:hypothetical protein
VPLSQLPEYKAREVGYLATDVEVQVERVLAGPPSLQNSQIVVTHMGGEQNGQRYIMEGEPLSAQGQAYVFFLRQAEAGRYVIVGGAQGRYGLAGGKLSNLSEEASDFPVSKVLSGMTLAAFERDFGRLAALRSPSPQAPEMNQPAQTQPEGSAPDKPAGPTDK